MKRIISSLAFAFMFLVFAQAQNQGNFLIQSQAQISVKLQELNDNFSNYELFSLNTKKVYDDFTRQGNIGYTDVMLDGEKITLSWADYQLCSPTYKLIAMDQNGEREVESKLKTYQGKVLNDPKANVAITVSDEFFSLMIERNGVNYYIEPAERFNPSAAGLFVLYKNTDYIGKKGFTCAHTETQQAMQQVAENEERTAPTCYRVQWAIASDHLMYAKYSNSITQVEARTLSVLNSAAVNYFGTFAFDYKFKVEIQKVSTCSNCLNVSSSTDADAIIQTFTQYGNSNGFGNDVDYDIGQFYTSRDITTGGSNGVIGYASVGAVCTNARYQIIEDFSTNADYMRVVVAHETGHNFSMTHDNAGDPKIMAPVVSAATAWSTQSVSQINGYVNQTLASSNNCFSICPPPNTPPVTDFKWEPSATCVGKTVQFADISENDPATYAWTFQGGTPATSTLKKPIVTYPNAGAFDVKLIATNAAGSTTKERKQLIFIDTIKTNFCKTSGTSNDESGITYVKLGNMVSNSGSAKFDGNKYVDYTCSRVASLSPNGTYELDLAIGDCETKIAETFRIWIDYNNDGDFLDSDEEIAFTANKRCGLITSDLEPKLTINVPGNVVLNRIVRCRIMSLKNSISNQPCYSDLTNIGQVEDYGIIFQPQFATGSLKKDITCYNTASGEIKLTTFGGVAPFSYTWDKAGVTGSNPKNLKAGTYTVTVTGADGATVKRVVKILQPASGLTKNIIVNDASCDEPNAVVSTYVGGGGGLYTYKWSNGTTNDSLINVTGGNYTLTITDNLGCSLVAPVTIATTPGAKLVVTKDTTVCNGKPVTITASGAGSYVWDSGSTNPSFTYTPMQKLTFYVTGILNDCIKLDSVTVDIGTIDATISSAKTVCEGNSVTLTAGGGDTYKWSTGETTANLTVNPTQTTTYNCLVKNGTCQETKSVVVTVTPNAAKATASQTSTCPGKSVSIKAEGGTYLWNDGKTNAEITVTPAATTTYTVTITSAGGCTKVIPTTITVGDLTASVTASTKTVCKGAKVDLTATGGSTYLWNNNTTAATQSVTPSATTTYTVTVTAANGCTKVIDTPITVNNTPAAPTVTASGALSFCQGGKVTLSAAAGFTYLWSSGEKTQTVTIDKSGTYTLKVTDANGCESPASAASTVSVKAAPTTPTVTPGGTVTICQGEKVSITATTSAAYLWSNGEKGQSISVTQAGDYSVKAISTDACESASSAVTKVVVNPAPFIPTITTAGNVLTSSAASGNQWFLNGVAIAGATTQQHTITKSGKYSVKVSNANNCSAISTEINVNKVGVNNAFNEAQIRVFPNPVHVVLTIDLTDLTEKASEMVILNALGQVLIQKNTTNESKYIFSTNNWSKGIYFINFKNAEQEVIGVKKFTKM